MQLKLILDAMSMARDALAEYYRDDAPVITMLDLAMADASAKPEPTQEPNRSAIDHAVDREPAIFDELARMIDRFDRFEVPFSLAELRRQIAQIKQKFPDAAPTQEPVQFLCKGTRFKTYLTTDRGVVLEGLPCELSEMWVALVEATDDCHMKLIAPPDAAAQIAELQKRLDAQKMINQDLIVGDKEAQEQIAKLSTKVAEGKRLLSEEMQRGNERTQIVLEQREQIAALSDMLDSERIEMGLVRKTLGVAYEPHQSLMDRTLEAASRTAGLEAIAERYRRLNTKQGIENDALAKQIATIRAAVQGYHDALNSPERDPCAVNKAMDAIEGVLGLVWMPAATVGASS